MAAFRSVVLAALLSAATGCRRDAAPAETPRCSDAVVIEVPYPGASPLEVEQGVVLAIESSISSVGGIAKIESTAEAGRAEFVIELDPGADVDATIGAIKSAVDGVTTLPADVERPLLFHPTMARHWVVATDPSALSGSEERLGTPRQTVTVEADPERLRAYGLTMEDLARTLRLEGLEGGPEDIGAVVLRTTDSGSVVKLGDIATIELEDVGPVVVRGNARVFVGRMLTPPPIGDSVLEVVAPGHCGAPSLVTVTARPPAALNRPQREQLARTLAEAAPSVVVVVADETVQLMAPAHGHAETVAARLLETVQDQPELVATDLEGVASARVLDLSHADLDAMHQAADAVIAAAAAAEDGTYAIRRGAPSAPQLDITLDQEAATRLGLSNADVARQIRAQRVGTEVARIDAQGAVINVRIVQPTRDDELDALMLRTPAGGDVPLTAVATLELGRTPATIARRDMRRTTSVIIVGPSAPTTVERLAKVARSAAPGLVATAREQTTPPLAPLRRWAKLPRPSC